MSAPLEIAAKIVHSNLQLLKRVFWYCAIFLLANLTGKHKQAFRTADLDLMGIAREGLMHVRRIAKFFH